MGDVVKLPTAARRQPQNNRYSAQRVAKKALRTSQPWPGEYLHQGQRDAITRAKIIRAVGATPEMAISAAILRALPQEARDHVTAQFAIGANCAPNTIARQAHELIRLERMTVGEMVDWGFANDYLNKSGG